MEARLGVNVRKNIVTVNKKIFIVALNPICLETSIALLKKHNFDIFVYKSISEVVARMYEEMPLCIFVSSECACDDLFSMQLLKMQNEVSIVGYTEKSLVSSVVKLSIFDFKYTIRPPLSGAAAYRIIQKVLTDRRLLAT